MLNSNQKQEISRYDLKKQLQGIQSFDISSFGESKSQSTNNIKGLMHSSNNMKSLFPNIDAPTLELLEDSEYNIRYLDQAHEHEQKQREKPPKKIEQKKIKDYYEDLTARNTQPSTAIHYQQKIQEMKRQMEKMQQKFERQRKENQLLHQKINLLEVCNKKVIDELKDKNKEQKEQIKLLKEREIKITREKEALQKEHGLNPMGSTNSTNMQYQGRGSRAGSISESNGGSNSIYSSTVLMTSYMEDPSHFCPELLSPEQTVVLLSKLLKKVSKSSKMIKELTDDKSVKTILSKIEKK